MTSVDSTPEFKRYRILWPDQFGLARGKYLPARSAARGTAFCVGVFLQGYDKGIYELETGVDVTGFPDVEAEYDLADARPGWEADTGIVMADLTFEHKPFEASPRRVLQRAVEAWRAEGLQPKVGIELEGYLLKADDDGVWQPFETPGAYVYGTGAIADSTGIINEIMERAEASGIPIESLNTEFDIPQFEMTLEYGDALESIDNVFLFKELAREVAHLHGYKFTFLGRPFAGRAGSGLHINFSLCGADGANALHDPSADDGLSDLARHCAAGVLAHHEALTLFCAPTVNAFRRLVPGELVGQWANWGYDHRCVAVRIPPQRGAGTRLEHRLADGAANPYTATAAVLQAALLGHRQALELGDPETGDGIESVNTTRRCPSDPGAAIAALQADEDFVAAVGADLVANLCGHKALEWESFVAAEGGLGDDPSGETTAWEIDTYLDYH